MISDRFAGIMERANFVGQFDSIGYDLPGTPAILPEPQEHPPKPSIIGITNGCGEFWTTNATNCPRVPGEFFCSTYQTLYAQ